jgi:hypothetical protein
MVYQNFAGPYIFTPMVSAGSDIYKCVITSVKHGYLAQEFATTAAFLATGAGLIKCGLSNIKKASYLKGAAQLGVGVISSVVGLWNSQQMIVSARETANARRCYYSTEPDHFSGDITIETAYKTQRSNTGAGTLNTRCDFGPAYR